MRPIPATARHSLKSLVLTPGVAYDNGVDGRAGLAATVTRGVLSAAWAMAGFVASEPSITIDVSSASPGETVHLSGTGCPAEGVAEAFLAGPLGETWDTETFEVADDGAWSGDYVVPDEAAEGSGFRYEALCRDDEGTVTQEYLAVEFTVIGTQDTSPPPVTPTPTATTSPPPSETSTPTATPPPSNTPTTTTGSPTSTGGAVDPLLEKVDEVVKALEEGSLAYRPPQTMREGVPEEVVIRVQRKSVGSDPAESLPGDDPVVVVPVEVFTLMTAELSGQGFEVTPAGQQRRTLPSARPAEWRWTVTPTTFGNRQLRLTLRVVLPEDPTTPVIPEKVYEETIDVQVHALHTSTRLARSVQGVLTASGLSVAVVAAVAWRFLRRRSSASAPGEAEGEHPGASTGVSQSE